MGDSRKVMYQTDQNNQQVSQAQGHTQHTQTVTIQQPRVIYGKQMPVGVPQEMQQQNVRIIYAQPSPMQMQVQVQGDLRTYVLPNQSSPDVSIKSEQDGQGVHQQIAEQQNVRIIYAQPPMQVQMQVQDPNNVRRITHLGLNTLQVQDGNLINRGEQVVCEVDLRQYQQMQAAASQQVVQHGQDDHHIRTVVMPQFHTTEIHPQHVDQSQQTPTLSMFSSKKKEKILLPCNFCKDSFRTECQLQAHIRNKHIKPFKCDSCWKAFSFESQLKLHVTTHTGEKPYKCDVCPKAYARKTALFNHVRVHARKKFFKCCKYCGKGFKNEMKLEKHERMHSMSDDRKYVTLEMFVDNKTDNM